MQYSWKPPVTNGKIKNNNNQLAQPYNGNLHFVSAPNVFNSGQLQQCNGKYINNMANVNEVVYQRTVNMQINDLEMNRHRNFRQQQQQHNFRPMYRRNIEQPRAAAFKPHRKVEFASGEVTNWRKQQNANVLTNIKKPLLTNEQLVKKDDEGGKKILIRRKPQQQVPETIVEETIVANDEENKNVETEAVTEKLSTESKEQQTSTIKEQEEEKKSAKPLRQKTPMCLINDLARFNRISFQYRLTSENGLAHCKRFTVTLMLGDEEYTAEGSKIKEAQHLAAKKAFEKTKYKHPTSRYERTDNETTVKPQITPTVELNALAMKLGQQTYYIIDQPYESNFNNNLIKQTPVEANPRAVVTQNQQKQPVSRDLQNLLNNVRLQNLPRYQNSYLPVPYMIQNGMYPSPSPFTLYPTNCPSKVSLTVGTRTFEGVGKTLQSAKHDAATNALKVLKEELQNEQLQIQQKEDDGVEDNLNKSPISMVFEVGIKRNLTVDFKVVREEGPAHMRTYVTACIVGELMTEGEGTGKKLSKKKAALKMLEELKKLPPLTPVATTNAKRVTKFKSNARKNCTLSKDNTNTNTTPTTTTTTNGPKNVEKPLSQRSKKNVTETETSSTNPINKLIEWHQNRKEKEPEFKVINEQGDQENSRRKEFIIEVSSNNIVVRGVGINKRLAKQDAAQKFLNAVNGTTEQTATTTTANEITSKKPNVNYKIRNESSANKLTNGKTIAIKDANANNVLTADIDKKLTSSPSEAKENLNETTTATKVAENQQPENCKTSLLQETTVSAINTSLTADVSSSDISTTQATSKESTTTTTTANKSVDHHMKDQLMYLGKLLGFEVKFSDYPRGNHNAFLTIVMLSTTPPQMCHGIGEDANESQENAAKNALKILREMGLNNAVKS